MEDSDTLSVFQMSNQLRNFVLVAVIAENPASHRYVVGNGSNVFSAFTDISGYSALVLIQKPARGLLKHTFKTTIISYFDHLIFLLHWQLIRDIDKWVADPLIRSPWIFGGWEVTFKLIWKRKKVITHQLRENGACLSLSQNPHLCLEHIEYSPVHSSSPQIKLGFKCSNFICQFKDSRHSPLECQVELSS